MFYNKRRIGLSAIWYNWLKNILQIKNCYHADVRISHNGHWSAQYKAVTHITMYQYQQNADTEKQSGHNKNDM